MSQATPKHFHESVVKFSTVLRKYLRPNGLKPLDLFRNRRYCRLMMSKKTFFTKSARDRSLSVLRDTLAHSRPGIKIDAKGYAETFQDTLLSMVSDEDFEADLRTGDGNELETKFRAAHSSSALAVNAFAPFRTRISDLRMPICTQFKELEFERKCPTGLRGGRSPNLDVVLSGNDCVVGIESKLTEYLTRHTASFSPAYAEQIRDTRRTGGYFREMLRLIERPSRYRHLDAAQLIKHAFGLARTFPDQDVTLLYLFWEPSNPTDSAEFARHREEIAEFSDCVEGAKPAFRAMSYTEIIEFWERSEPADWLVRHLREFRARYIARI